ncbi:MAG TPA: 3-oxoacyl-ACP synthase, partial [Pedomonas sp.]|nr:3-oxoacyl-ACP synthase [Pedomonas sp.]
MSGALRSRVIGCGSYLPERVVSNEELSKTVDTSDEWIIERTGIRQRYIAADDQKTSDLATEAAKAALAHAGVDASEIDLIVVATATPDDTFPAVATQVQRKLGITHGAAFDVQAVCSGFIYALSVT